MTHEQQQLLEKFQLTSDLFFSVALEDISACQEVLQILLNKTLVIEDVKVQYSIRQLLHHSIVLDVLAYETIGTKINLEMHPQSGESRVKRMRYNLSSLDMESLAKSVDYNNIPDTIGIYITQADFLRTKKGINHVLRTVEGTNQKIQNGVEEYYICLSKEGNTPEQTALMKYLLDSSSDTESTSFPNLVKRVQFLKKEPKGVEIMCEIMDQLMAEAAAEATAKITKKMKKKLVKAEAKAVKAEAKATKAEAKATKAEAKGIIETLYEMNVAPDIIIQKLMSKLHLQESDARAFLK